MLQSTPVFKLQATSSIAPSEATDRTETLQRTRILEQWTIARFALQRATQNYVTACEAIEADCKRSSTSFLDECALEETFVAINSELTSLAIDEQRLWKARATLKGLRNRSSILSPRPNNSHCTSSEAQGEGENQAIAARLRRPDMATVISSVNIYWRRLSVRTRELWSHIDLGESGARTDTPFAKAKLWLERSRAHHYEVHAALARWLTEGAPRSLRSLAITIPWPPKHGDTPHALPPGMLHREQREAFLNLCVHSILTVHISAGAAPRSKPCRPTPFTNQRPRVPNCRTPPDLGLEHVEPQGICLLLPLLAPEPGLYVKLEGYTRDPGEVGEALTDLFARSKVDKLHFSTFVNPAQLPRMLVRLQHLRSFTWQGLNIGDEFFETMAHNSTTADGQSNVNGNEEGNESANTRSAYLSEPAYARFARMQYIRRRAARVGHKPRHSKLTISGCHILVDGTGEDAPRLMEDLEKCLNDSVPDLLLKENSLIVQD
ncbi:hypothetical protein RHS01_07211 [Rhizoctonia solani]|uniref:Uncharacterized protein n=1 Tax=Rhizoctonia solani TaxID=456999 RepID=A0A8H7IAI0_9AGAM|nr:hypothetical protein RHS01_07211 [Rhizoctonia solani]